MTEEQINAAIAEACGWTEIRNSVYRHHKPWGHPPLNRDRIKLLPDYCNDLNAMHEAEMTLTSMQLYNYIALLVDACYEATLAPARQRAKAFLRTLGKWEATDKDSLTVQAATTEQSSVDHLREATKMMEVQS